MLLLIALTAGGLFGLGIALSGMINPAKVQGFLNLFGDWDPSLAFVMGGALLVFAPCYGWWRRNGRTTAAIGTTLPQMPAPNIDIRLVLGALIFGIGWGLVGICPGPALGLIASLQWQAGVFVLAMMLGFWLVGKLKRQFKGNA